MKNKFKKFLLTAAAAFTMLGHAMAETAPGDIAAIKKAEQSGASKKEELYVPGELIVKFKAGVAETKKDRAHGKYGGEKINELKELRMHQVKLKANGKVKETAALYALDPDVEYAEPNYLVSINSTPNDPMFSIQWAAAKMRLESAWNATTGSRDVVVGVIDTGIDYNHPDLRGNLWVNSLDPLNGLDDDRNGHVDDVYGANTNYRLNSVLDDNSHGTHVAGTIGAIGNNQTGVAGVTWGVKIVSAKALDKDGGGSVWSCAQGFVYLRKLKERVQDPVNITAVNASFGFYAYSRALRDAIRGMGDTLVIAAAGNDSDVARGYPASYVLPNLITVAATDQGDELAVFSNYGDRVHVGAPGVGILSTVKGGGYAIASGTSTAAPQVTGLAALLKAQDPLRSGNRIRNLILSSGESLPSLSGKTTTGKRADAYAATHCTDAPLLSVGPLPFPVNAGGRYPFYATSINCDAAVGPVTVTASNGETFTLYDNGEAPDLAAGDGLFTGYWTVPSPSVTLTFASPAGIKIVTLPSLRAEFYLADARAGVPYLQPLQAAGGVPPYSWSIKEGGLPSGLQLDPVTGVISGTTGAAGAYPVTAEVSDATGAKATAAVKFQVVTDAVDQIWGRSFGNGGGDSGEAVISDGDNFYVAATVSNGVDRDLLLAKFDSAGNLSWSRAFDQGGEERGSSVARDGYGNLYLLGGTSTSDSSTEQILLKLDPTGNMIWKNTWTTESYTSTSTPKVAVDAAGYAYTVGPKSINMIGDALEINRFDPAGNRIWNRVYPFASNVYAAAIDAAGNFYLGGATSNSPLDHLLVKYDSSGNLLWSKTLDEGIYDHIKGIALDTDGNVIATGTSQLTGGIVYGVTYKFTPSGEQLWRSATTGEQFLMGTGVSTAPDAIYLAASVIRPDESSDGVIVKMDLSGKEIWRRTLDGSHNESLTGIVADASGVTVTGWGLNGDNIDLLLARYSEQGSRSNDLSIAGLSGTVSGSLLSYTVRVRNDGTGSAPASLALYLSSDDVPSTSDHLLTNLYAGVVKGGVESTLSGTVKIPAQIPAGTYRLVAIVDPAAVVRETDEVNNGSVAAGSFALSGAGSDLRIGAVTASVQGATLSYSVTVENPGTVAAAPSIAALYLWTGASAFAFDNQVAQLATPAIAAGGTTVLSGSLPVGSNSTIAPATYRLVAVADLGRVVEETDEANNGAIGSQFTLLPDLAWTGLTAALSGGTLSCTATVRNPGDIAAPAWLSLRLSQDAVLDTRDGYLWLGESANLGNVAGGAEKTVTLGVVVPPVFAAGSYYVLGELDGARTVPELNESNNVALAGRLTLGSDLQVASVNATLAGDRLSYSIRVRNAGNIAAAASTTGLYLSTDAIASPADVLVSHLATPVLGAGAETVLTGSVQVPSPLGSDSYYLAAIADSGNAAAESLETNNGAVGNRVTISNDLSITRLTGTVSGGVLSYTVAVRNSGTGNASTAVVLYLSSDAAASANDLLIKQIPVMLAGSSERTFTGTVNVPGTIASGSYYLAALADPANAVLETDETDNAAVAERFELTTDLQVTAVSATLAEGKVNYTLTLKNAGSVGSAPSSTGLYLSADAVPSLSDFLLLSLSTSSIPAGAEKVFTGAATVPSTIPPGNYHVAVMADSANVMREAVETNNGAAGNQLLLSNDLSISGLSGTLSAGVLSYSLTVSNSGSGSATVPVYLYFSSDASASTNDVLIRQITGVSVAGGTQRVLSGTVTVPSTVPSGSYYFAAVVDPANAVPESEEANNGSVSAGTFTITSDFQVTAVSATLAAGQLTYSFTVRNAGSIGAPSSKTGLYLATGASYIPVSQISTPAITAGSEKTLTGSVAVPATIPPGSYGVAAVADSTGVLSETVESNNGAIGNQVALANDLSLTALSGTVSAGVLSYTVTVRNTGTGSVTAPLVLYFSPDAVASTNDIVIRQLSASAVAGGSEKVLAGTLTVPGTVADGTYFLTAVIDPANVVAESSEANNGAVAGSIRITSDLDVTAVTATLAGGRLSYSVTVKNNGSIGTPSTKTGLYFSADGVAATSDLLLGSLSTSPIAYGKETVLTGSVAVPAGTAPGTYYVTAIADAGNVVSEGAEGNNGGVGNQVALANDLSLTSLSGTLSAGILSYSVTVRNSGTGNAGAPVYLYFSADSTASTGDLVIKQLSATSVAGDSERTLTGTFAVPGSVPSGSYYFAAVVDPLGAVPESNEQNNGAVAQNMTVSSNLRVTGVSATLAGGRLAYSVIVKNEGNIVTPATSTGIYLSADGIASTADLLLGSVSTSAIPYGTEKVLTGSVAVPATVAPASYHVTAIADVTGVVSETVETDNGLAGNTVELSNNLSVTALNGSLSGGVLSYSMTVKNSGTGNPPVAATLYFSTDNAASTGDIIVKAMGAGSIPGGTEKVVTGSVTLPGTIASGTYYLTALADPANAVAETVESDNGAVASQFTVNSDLDVVAVSATVSGGRATYSITLRNNGNIASAASKTGLYFSADAVAAYSDLLIASISTSAIPAGGERILTGSASVPAAVGPGSYSVAAIADTENAARENDETNNSMVGNQVALSNDISITALSGTLSGGVLSYSVTLANAGNLNPSVPVALSFSTDGVASANDYQLRLFTGSVPGGSEKVLTGTVTVPATVPTGSFYLAAYADPAALFPETNEGNNGRANTQFAVNSDLQVTAVSGSVTAGVLSYSVTVTNAGNIAAAASSTGVYLSADGAPSLSDHRVATLSTSSLPAGGVKVLTGRVPIPATVPAGSYYLAGIADIAGLVAESAEGNNGAVGGTVAR